MNSYSPLVAELLMIVVGIAVSVLTTVLARKGLIDVDERRNVSAQFNVHRAMERGIVLAAQQIENEIGANERRQLAAAAVMHARALNPQSMKTVVRGSERSVSSMAQDLAEGKVAAFIEALDADDVRKPRNLRKPMMLSEDARVG